MRPIGQRSYDALMGSSAADERLAFALVDEEEAHAATREVLREAIGLLYEANQRIDRQRETIARLHEELRAARLIRRRAA